MHQYRRAVSGRAFRMNRDDIIFSPAASLARAIHARDLSAVEATECYLRQIARHNDRLNAVVSLDADGALRQARSLDERLARGEVDWEKAPLSGVPITLKDCHEVAGMRSTAGHPPLAEYVPKEDGTVARRLRAAGAIFLGRTNVAALLADIQSTNEIFGRTNNPWNLDRTPGGSSGGAAVAVAAGMAALDAGSDIGGSIRIPAHCCGIYGLKPTEHRVSNHGHIPDLPEHPRSTRVMNSIGPLARSVDDLALVLRVIEGPDGIDTDVPALPDAPAVIPPSDLGKTRVAWAGSFPGLPAAADVRAAVERVAATLAGRCAAVEESLPPIDFDAQLQTRAELRPYVRVFLEPPETPPSAADYFRVLDRRDGFIRAWEAFFDTWDVLVCPVMPVSAFEHCPRETPIPVDGVPREYMSLAGYCRPFNLTGHPVVTVPVGLDRDGLPIGVQLVGRRWDDWRLLGIARAIDAISGQYRIPPGYGP
jgi:amidase